MFGRFGRNRRQDSEQGDMPLDPKTPPLAPAQSDSGLAFGDAPHDVETNAPPQDGPQPVKTAVLGVASGRTTSDLHTHPHHDRAKQHFATGQSMLGVHENALQHQDPPAKYETFASRLPHALEQLGSSAPTSPSAGDSLSLQQDAALRPKDPQSAEAQHPSSATTQDPLPPQLPQS